MSAIKQAQLFAAVCLCFVGNASYAGDVSKTCPTATVQYRSFSVVTWSAYFIYNLPPHPSQDTVVQWATESLREWRKMRPSLTIAPAPRSSSPPLEHEKTFIATAVGPFLGSMDSPTIHTSVVCTAGGVNVKALITRSAGYYGSATNNEPWVPRLVLVVVLTRPSASLAVTWDMRLPDGAKAHSTQTAGFPDRKYPFTLEKMIYERSR